VKAHRHDCAARRLVQAVAPLGLEYPMVRSAYLLIKGTWRGADL
jgi:hypothetical protein